MSRAWRVPASARGARRLRALALGVLATLAAAAGAETLYVVDRLEIGVHESTELDSVILEVVATGTPLTVLRRDGEFVRVRTPDGNEGWVDGRYLVGDEPAGGSSSELQKRLDETARDLGAARAEVEVLRQRLAEARQAATGGANEAAAGATAREVDEVSSRLRKALDELAALAEKNQQLERQLAELDAARAAAETQAAEANRRAAERTVAPAPPPEPARQPESSDADKSVLGAWRPWGLWHWLAFVSFLALAFALGGWAVDWNSRRRHGGFRI